MNLYKEKLEKLGYKLQDCGNHWRTRAIYRNGKTSTSVIIYKDSGVWRDFGGSTEPKPFNTLVRETLKTEDIQTLNEFLVGSEAHTYEKEEPKEKIEMEKIYPKSYLEKLLPVKTFYEKRGISTKTQDLFECGYAGGGKMYRRIVFPIYNLEGQIHGFSGRSILDQENIPKWKHTGRRNDWIYPNHLSKDFIEKNDEVILVESIGDCLALHESGFKNVLVTFGLDASSKLIAYMNSFNLKRIIISTNNDKNKEINSGGNASIKAAAKLSQIFDLSLIKINPPTSNDFGDMLQEGKDFSEWYARSDKWSLNDPNFQKWIIKKINSSGELKKNTHCQKLIKILNES